MERPHYVELSGPPRQRGRMHGEALRAVIADAIEAWRQRLAGRLGGDPQRYVDWLRAETGFAAAIDRWTPELADEIAGIAEGADLEPDWVWAWQLLDEHPWLLDRFAPADAGEKNCSSLGLAGRDGKPTLLAQNLDLPAFKEGLQTVLQIRDETGQGTLLVTQAGAVSSLGLNGRGVGVCVNTLASLPTSTDGLPVTCVIRGVLERDSLAAAVEFLRTVPHASGQNYLLGSPAGVVDLECGAGHVVRWQRPESDAAVWHTNHPLAGDSPAAGPPPSDIPPLTDASGPRCDLLDRRLGAGIAHTADAVKSLLAEAPVCRPLDSAKGAFTAACAVMELGDAPTLHIAPGPADRTAFHLYRV